jgi:hypothetical protein
MTVTRRKWQGRLWEGSVSQVPWQGGASTEALDLVPVAEGDLGESCGLTPLQVPMGRMTFATQTPTSTASHTWGGFPQVFI